MAERGNGSAGTGGEAGRTPTPSAEDQQSAQDPLDLRGRMDRFGELLARGLDLAEAGLSLGLTMLGTVGGAAQTKIIERMLNPGADVGATQPNPRPEAAQAALVGASAAAGVAAGAEPPANAFGITNRMKLTPGGKVRISFSINNDSAASEKDVTLVADLFAGERSGARLPDGALTVTPREAKIAPMDFEKFLLEGTIPEATPPDFYHGSVIVLGDDAMRIPVVLSVQNSP